MRNLEGRNIGAVEDGERLTVVSGESEKSRVVALQNVSRRRVIIPIDVVFVSRKGGKDKHLGTGERNRRRGGGRSDRHRSGGGGKTAGGGGRSSIGSIIVFFFKTSAGRELQSQVDNNGENDRADDANGRALCVHGNSCERSGREGDDGDNDSSLSDWLCFYFEGEFHERSQRQRGRR